MTTFTEDNKLFRSLEDNKKKCKRCGHTLIISKQEKALCDYCGYYIFRDKKCEFKYRLKEAIIKKKHEERSYY